MSDARAIVRWSRAAKGARRIPLRVAGWLTAAAVLCAAPAARAASDTWDGSDSGAWSNAANWVGNQAPGNTTSGATTTTDLATFSNGVNTTITVDAGRTISGLTFAEGAGAFTFRGNPLYISTSGSITISGTSASVSTSTVPSQTFYVDLTATTSLRNIFLAKPAGAPLGSIHNLMSGTVRTSGVGGQNGSLQFNGNSISMVRGVIANSGLGGITSVSTESNGGQLAWLRATNTFTGDVTLRRSLLLFDSVTNVNGGASALGNATSGTIQMGFTSSGLNETALYYTGLAPAGHSTNRAIFLPQTNQGVLVAAGVGPLTWTGNVSGSNATANTFVLAGPSAAENIYGGAVVDSGTTILSLLKRGNGTWNLTGANTYTGTTRITSGLLRVDFANSGAVNTNIVSASSPLVTGGGSLDVRGEAGENNSQTFNGTSFREGSMAISLTPGGGGSVSLALGALARGIAGSGSNSGSTVDFTLGSSGSVSTTTSTLTNGVLVVGGVAMASVGKSDWATVSSGTVAAVSSYETATNPASWSAVSNVSLTGNPSADVTTGTINTLRLAGASTVTITSANTLSLGAGGLLAAGSGGAMLITGGTLRGANGSTQPERDLVVLQHNTTSALTIASSIANAAAGATSLTKGGNGMLELSGSNSFSGGITIGGGVLKISNPNAMGSSSVKLAGGILGLAAGDISSATIGSGAVNRFSWQGSGGFAAYGGNRTITFSDASFDLSTASATNAQRNGELLLSAPDADGKITLAMSGGNSLWIVKTTSAPFMGTIRVADGSVPVDAEISAPIAVVADARGGIQKMGAGVLQLSGSNTYNGPTIVAEGGLVVSGTNYNAMVTEVRGGAWLGGNGTITSLEVQSGGTVAPGLLNTNTTSTIGTLATTANAGNGYFLWNGSTNSAAQMAFQLSTSNNTSDSINLGTDNFIKGTGSTFKFDFQNSGGKVGETYTLVSFGTTTYTTTSDFSYENLGTYTGTFGLTSGALTFTIPYLSTTYALSGSAAASAIRVGGSTSIGATVTNTGPNDQYDAVGFSGLAVTVSGGTVSLSPSSGTAAQAGSANGTAFFTPNTSGSFTLTPVVTSATNVNLGTAASGSTTTFAVTAWNPAAANTISGTFNLGAVLVSSTLTKTLSVTNTAPNDGFSEKLDAGFGSLSGVTTNSGSINLLAPQATDNTAMSIYLASGIAGSVSGTAQVNFWTDGAGTSGLSALQLDSQAVTLTGTFLDPAVASFTSGSTTTSLLLDFGTVNQNGSVSPLGFDLWNLVTTAGYTADLALVNILSGTGNTGAITTTLTGTFTNLASGTFNPYTASLATANEGTFTNVYTLEFKSASGGTVFASDTPQSLTLTVQGVVVAAVPEPSTVVLATVGVGLAGIAARRRRRNRDTAGPARRSR